MGSAGRQPDLLGVERQVPCVTGRRSSCVRVTGGGSSCERQVPCVTGRRSSCKRQVPCVTGGRSSNVIIGVSQEGGVPGIGVSQEGGVPASESQELLCHRKEEFLRQSPRNCCVTGGRSSCVRVPGIAVSQEFLCPRNCCVTATWTSRWT